MAADTSKPPSPATRTTTIFVFGTDLMGQHDGDSASFAARFHDAEKGVGEGPTGTAYAVPFQDAHRRPLPLEAIAEHVERLFAYAREHPDKVFHIARFGCDPESYDDAQLAALFAQAPGNCRLPALWSLRLNPKLPARMLLYDPGAHMRDRKWQRRLQHFLTANQSIWNVSAVELVSVGPAAVVVANDTAAKALGLKHHVIGEERAAYGRDALAVAELKAIWFSTHLLGIIDFERTAETQIVRVVGAATRSGLYIDQLDSSAQD